MGSSGQLGIDLLKTLNKIGSVTSLNKSNGDLLKLDELFKTFENIKPNVIVNAAAYTLVDKAEEENDLALKINYESIKEISTYCYKNNITLVHFSTDYVFDGKSEKPIKESHPTNPINFYGYTKELADNAIVNSRCNHFIFRISWVYSKHGKNFPNTIIELCSTKKIVSIVDDQFGSPTSTDFIAKVVADCLYKKIKNNIGSYGIYNLTTNGIVSWYEFATTIIEHAEKKGKRFLCPAKKLQPIKSSQFPTAAKRPIYSKLCNKKIIYVFSVDINSWFSYYEKVF